MQTCRIGHREAALLSVIEHDLDVERERQCDDLLGVRRRWRAVAPRAHPSWAQDEKARRDAQQQRNERRDEQPARTFITVGRTHGLATEERGDERGDRDKRRSPLPELVQDAGLLIEGSRDLLVGELVNRWIVWQPSRCSDHVPDKIPPVPVGATFATYRGELRLCRARRGEAACFGGFVVVDMSTTTDGAACCVVCLGG